MKTERPANPFIDSRRQQHSDYVGKMGDTKGRILELLKQRRQTLTDISTRLDLAPSTVSQHLQEMNEAGLIRQINDRPAKWKYYEINRAQNIAFARDVPGLRKLALPIVVILIGIITVLSIAYAFDFGSGVSAQQVLLAPGAPVPAGVTVFAVSDAPTSYNISALYVTIHNASIRGSSGKWHNIPLQTSTFNLVALDNLSAILSGVNLAGGRYTAMRLGISNVSAVLNGTATNVFLPRKTLLLVGNINISSNTTNWINLDFNLQRSLFITKNGSIVMLPVMILRNSNGAGLKSNRAGILITKGAWHVRSYAMFGMNYTGKVARNFTPPQNLSIEAGGHGRLIAGGGKGTPTEIVWNNNGIWINRNGTWNAANRSAIQNYTGGSPLRAGGLIAGLFGWLTVRRGS